MRGEVVTPVHCRSHDLAIRCLAIRCLVIRHPALGTEGQQVSIAAGPWMKYCWVRPDEAGELSRDPAGPPAVL